MTAESLIEPTQRGTRYRAIARHADGEARAKHGEMGFTAGWGTALDQLVEMVELQARGRGACRLRGSAAQPSC